MKALSGITVLDLSTIVSGPFCTQMLSDMGAEIIKVEPISGDPTRAWGPPFVAEESPYFISVNRGKKSLAIDINSPQGISILYKLIQKCDVLVENFTPDRKLKYGLVYDKVKNLNSKIIHLSITGFGYGTNAIQNTPALDLTMQALTGIMSVTGPKDEEEPVRIGVAWLDVLTGLTGTSGILSALIQLGRTDKGQYIDLSLFDVALMSSINIGETFLMTGKVPNRLGSEHPQIVPYQAFKAKDYWFTLAVVTEKQYERLVKLLSPSPLDNNASFATNSSRVKNREELLGFLKKLFSSRTRSDWLKILTESNIPVSPINNIDEVFQMDIAKERNSVWSVNHPAIGKLPLLANALQHTGPGSVSNKIAPPLLGQHTYEILKGFIKLSEQEIDFLKKSGGIFCSQMDTKNLSSDKSDG